MFFIGFGTGLIFSLVSTMVTEYIPHRSASMIALNSLGRNLFAIGGGSVAQPLLSALDSGWVYTGLGVIFAASAFIVLTIRKNGQKWRENIDHEIGIDRYRLDMRVVLQPIPSNDVPQTHVFIGSAPPSQVSDLGPEIDRPEIDTIPEAKA